MGIKDTCLDWLYPPVCLLCGSLLPLEMASRAVCPECFGGIPFIKGNVCENCGRPLETEKLCKTCLGKGYLFQRGYSVFQYKHMRFAIRHFKFLGNKIDAKPLGAWMNEFIDKNYTGLWEHIDLLVPVPVHKKRLKARGFNQAELLAKEIESHTHIPCAVDNLLRVKETLPQNQLNEQQRFENCRNAFSVADEQQFAGKTVMLIDDIFTTGTTLNACASVLIGAGTKEVIPYCLSIVHLDDIDMLI